MSVIDWISRSLVIIGGLNWGLIAVSRYDFVAKMLGVDTSATRFVYGLVGLAALYQLIRLAFREPVGDRREAR